MGFIKFMAGLQGRLLRVIAGLALIYIGYFGIKGISGDIVSFVGLVPLLAGVLDFCIIAPLVGAPFSGKAVRKL